MKLGSSSTFPTRIETNEEFEQVSFIAWSDNEDTEIKVSDDETDETYIAFKPTPTPTQHIVDIHKANKIKVSYRSKHMDGQIYQEKIILSDFKLK